MKTWMNVARGSFSQKWRRWIKQVCHELEVNCFRTHRRSPKIRWNMKDQKSKGWGRTCSLRRSRATKTLKLSKFSSSRSRSPISWEWCSHESDGRRRSSTIGLFCKPKHSPRRRNEKVRDPSPEVVWLVNKSNGQVPPYHTYCIVDKSTQYDGNVAKSNAKGSRRLQTQMNSHTLDERSSISVISLVAASEMTCDTNGVHESMRGLTCTRISFPWNDRRRSHARQA